jgi:hypothetical protein
MAKITDFKIGDRIYRLSEVTGDNGPTQVSVKLDLGYKDLFSVEDVFADDWIRLPAKKTCYTLVYINMDRSNTIDGIMCETYEEAFSKKGQSQFAFVAKVEWEQ